MSDPANVSVIIPSKGGEYLEYTLKSLSEQTIMPEEIILILKECNATKINSFCNELKLNATIEEQISGYVTGALNIGKSIANGNLVIITDDDAILPEKWIENYLMLFKKYSNKIGSFSSRDIYYNILTNEIKKTPDDLYRTKFFRILIRPIFEPPHLFLERYKLGSYISKKFNFIIGRGIPNNQCYSLPFRGVNMAFRREAIDNINFFEHREYKKGFRYEQHFGVQLVLNGYDSIYTPINPVYHIMRPSLSRVLKRDEFLQLMKEEEIIRNEVRTLLGK